MKKKMPINTGGGRKPEHEPISQLVSVKEAVEALPEDMIKALSKHDYKGIRGHSAKLTQPQQIELMEFIARYATMDEINGYFVQNYKVSLSLALISQYRHTAKWKPVIAKLREKYLLNPGEVAMSHKRVRLDRRERIYHQAMKKDSLKDALHAIDGSQEEMEQKGGINLTFNQYASLSDDEVEEQIKEKLERLKNLNAIEVNNEAVTKNGQP